MGATLAAWTDAAITELRPRIGAGSRSVDAILEFVNPGAWRAGGSVTVAVVVDARARSVTVPPESIVRRPAGTIVYVAAQGTARQRVATMFMPLAMPSTTARPKLSAS